MRKKNRTQHQADLPTAPDMLGTEESSTVGLVQRRGAKSKNDRRKVSSASTSHDNTTTTTTTGNSSVFDKRSCRSPAAEPDEDPAQSGAKNDDAIEEARHLSDTNFQLLLTELAACDKRSSEKSTLAKQLLDGASNNKSSHNNNSLVSSSSNNTNHNSAVGGATIHTRSQLTINNNTNNRSKTISNGNVDNHTNTKKASSYSSVLSSNNNNNNNLNNNSSSNNKVNNSNNNGYNVRNGKPDRVLEEAVLRSMGSVTARNMGGNESRSGDRDNDEETRHASMIMTGRVEEIRNGGENGKRKKKDIGVKKSYKAGDVQGHMGYKPIETLMEMFKSSEEPANTSQKGKTKNSTKAKETHNSSSARPTVTVAAPTSEEGNNKKKKAPSPISPKKSPERTRPLSPQSERGGSPADLAERCDVSWLSDPDRAEPEDWEKVTRKTRKQRKPAPAPLVAPERNRDHRETSRYSAPSQHHHHHHHHHHGNNHHHASNSSNQQQQQQITTPLSSLIVTSSSNSTAATASTAAAVVAPVAAIAVVKKTSTALTRIGTNAEDEFPPIGPPPNGARPFVADLKPKPSGPWGSGRMADVLQGKKVTSPPNQQAQPMPSDPTVATTTTSPPAASATTSTTVPSPTPTTIAARTNEGAADKTSTAVNSVKSEAVCPIITPGPDEAFGDDFRGDEGLSFGNFDIETIRSIKASARIRDASEREEEDLRERFNYHQCVELLSSHWMEISRKDAIFHQPSPEVMAANARRE